MTEAFTDRIDRLRRELEALRAAQIAAPASDDAGTGSARDGQVEAFAVRGRLRSITLEPRVMRWDSAVLAEALGEASTEALRATPAIAPATAPADLSALGRQLATAQAQAERTASMISAGLAEAIARVGDRTGMRGDARLTGLTALLEETGAALRAATAPSGEAVECGRGGDADGLISVEAGPGPTIKVELHPYAMRRASQDIAEGAVIAANAALDALDAHPVVMPAGQQSGAMRDDSVAGMRDSTQSLAAIMASIREP